MSRPSLACTHRPSPSGTPNFVSLQNLLSIIPTSGPSILFDNALCGSASQTLRGNLNTRFLGNPHFNSWLGHARSIFFPSCPRSRTSHGSLLLGNFLFSFRKTVPPGINRASSEEITTPTWAFYLSPSIVPPFCLWLQRPPPFFPHLGSG